MFRFGHVRNSVYSYFAAHGPSPRQVLVFLGGLFAAPNAGVLWFWPSAVTVLFMAALAPFVGPRRRRRIDAPPRSGPRPGPDNDRGRRSLRLARRIEAALDGRAARRWHPAIVLLVFLALNASLAMWWAPYGWFGWGPRLTLSWVPALVLLALLSSGTHLEELLARLLDGPRRVVATGLAVGVTALPHLGGALRAHTVNEFFGAYRVLPGRPRYYEVVDEYAFRRFPVLLSAFKGLLSPVGVILAAAVLWTSVRLLRAVTPVRPAATPAPRPRRVGPGRPGCRPAAYAAEPAVPCDRR